MPGALRELFITIILFCMPSNPQQLFDKHHVDWADDFVLKARKKSLILSDSQLRTKILIDLRQRLNAWGRDLKDFRIKEPTDEELKEIEFYEKDKYPVLIREELDFDVLELSSFVEARRKMLKESQRNVFEVSQCHSEIY
jgi:hypothetical protein